MAKLHIFRIDPYPELHNSISFPILYIFPPSILNLEAFSTVLTLKTHFHNLFSTLLVRYPALYQPYPPTFNHMQNFIILDLSVARRRWLFSQPVILLLYLNTSHQFCSNNKFKKSISVQSILHFVPFITFCILVVLIPENSFRFQDYSIAQNQFVPNLLSLCTLSTNFQKNLI